MSGCWVCDSAGWFAYENVNDPLIVSKNVAVEADLADAASSSEVAHDFGL